MTQGSGCAADTAPLTHRPRSHPFVPPRPGGGTAVPYLKHVLDVARLTRAKGKQHPHGAIT
jgi:hypothetical protein